MGKKTTRTRAKASEVFDPEDFRITDGDVAASPGNPYDDDDGLGRTLDRMAEKRFSSKAAAKGDKRTIRNTGFNALVLRLLEYEFEHLHEDLKEDCPEFFDYLGGAVEDVEVGSGLWDELCRLDSLWSDGLEGLIDLATWEDHEHLTRNVLFALPNVRGYDSAGEAVANETFLFLEKTGFEFESVRGRKQLLERLRAGVPLLSAGG